MASDRPTVAPLRLSLESSYLLAGQSGFPLRGGLLVTYRPDRLLGLGVHLDTNFTDHFSATARGEAIWPIHRYFQFQGAIELGARAFMNQRLSQQGEDRMVNGALFTFGGEIAAAVPFSDVVGASLFLRAFYSPGGGLSSSGMNGEGPALGVQAEGGEVLLGLRLDFYPPVAPHHRDPAEDAPRPARADAAEAAPAPSQREALQDLEHSVEALLEGPSAAVRPAGGGDAGAETAVSADAAAVDGEAGTAAALSPSDREEILALQREIRGLTDSSAALETELEAATQILNDLSAGQETVGPFHIRLDSFYDRLTARPPSLDLPAFTTFLGEFRELIRDNGSVRLLTQSPTESFGDVIVGNFSSARDALRTYQRRLPRRSRAELEPALAEMGAIVAELEQLRRHPESTQPPAHQVQLWRIRLDRIRGHIEEIAPRLEETAAQSLRSN
ncbi:MAG TPA: hypothetical protein VJP40_00775, partial [bacterium]|nr:hypothetical protein [bacterium]